MFGWNHAHSRKRVSVTPGLVMRALAVAQASPPPRAGLMPYLLLQVRCDRGVEHICAPIAAALHIVRGPGTTCEGIMSGLMLVTFPNKGKLTQEVIRNRDETALALIRQLGSRVRIVKGTVTGLFGAIGRGSDSYWGSAFPGIETICAELFAQPYGTCKSNEPARSELPTTIV